MYFFLFEYICIFDWSQGDIIKIRTQHIPAILDFFGSSHHASVENC